jgi:G:T-mismatch repair DNA endonuclease (very short patch repair protein)
MKKITEYFKPCPNCNKNIYYSNKYHLKKSINKKTQCQSCFAKQRAKSKEYREKLSQRVKKSWENAEERKKKQKEHQINFWKNLSEDERKIICDKMSENFNRSEERIDALKKFGKDLWSSEEFREKWLKANNSPESSEKRRNNILKQHRDPNSKLNSKEVKIKRLNNFKKNWKNKSPEEKKAILENLSKTLHVISGTSKLELRVAKNIAHLGFKSKATIAGYCVDIIHETLPIIVEVNGDFWHANPTMYSADWVNNINKRTAQEIWDREEKRISELKEAGYEVIVLWQKDIKNNKDYVTKIKEYIDDFNKGKA